jgi:hypothetical protein
LYETVVAPSMTATPSIAFMRLRMNSGMEQSATVAGGNGDSRVMLLGTTIERGWQPWSTVVHTLSDCDSSTPLQRLSLASPAADSDAPLCIAAL